MRVASAALRNFRVYETAVAPLGDGLTVVVGPNGAGKTNLLDAIYLGCTGRSFRTTNERELIKFGADSTRVELVSDDGETQHRLAVMIAPPEDRRMTIDGNPVARLLDSPLRPLVTVFSPDRLELIKGAPALRRAHVDQLVAGLWPARVVTRRFYNETLAQRNACLSRVRSGQLSATTLDSWDRQLATHGLALIADRHAAISAVSDGFSQRCRELGLDGDARCEYRPRTSATSIDELVAELADTRSGDIERGFTGHGPHRDELKLSRDGRELRRYGSQGEQRIALLALLLSERAALAAAREAVPLLLLDDVMSELDSQRRAALIAMVVATGQTVITTTDSDHVPMSTENVTVLKVSDGEIVCAPPAIGSQP